MLPASLPHTTAAAALKTRHRFHIRPASTLFIASVMWRAARDSRASSHASLLPLPPASITILNSLPKPRSPPQ